MSTSDSVLAIVGGGRWGQVWLSILTQMQIPFDRIVIVSKHHAQTLRDEMAVRYAASSVPVELVTSTSELFAKYQVKAGLIVNTAKQHFETAMEFIEREIHVLIEKPVVLKTEHMRILIQKAQAMKVILVPGLSYRFCSYLKNFSDEVARKGLPTSFQIDWFDAQNEVRYGQRKTHDDSISIVEDVGPHIWTILSRVFPDAKLQVKNSVTNKHDARILLSAAGISGVIVLHRQQLQRRRYISIQFDVEKLALDFSTEPGVIKMGSEECSADPLWLEKPSPLRCEARHFFSLIASENAVKDDLQCCLDSVAFVDSILATQAVLT